MQNNAFLFGIVYSIRGCLVSGGSTGECTDLHGRIIAPGLHYVPGPDSCTLCICDSGSPKWCKAVLCSPPQDCKSFRLGNSCCEFICLDTLETLQKPSGDSNHESTTDLGLRLIAYAITVVLFLSLFFFLVHRFRQRKLRGRQNRQLSEDERSLGSIGYIAGSLAYLPGSVGSYLGSAATADPHHHHHHHLEFRYGNEENGAHYPLWKPPGSSSSNGAGYFPRGEAPPPYEEAVAAARAEAALAVAVAAGSLGTTTVGAGAVTSGLGTGHRTIPINLATSGSFRIETAPPPAIPVTESNVSRPVTETPITAPTAAPRRQRPSSSGAGNSEMTGAQSVHARLAEQGSSQPLPSSHSEDVIRSDVFYEDVLVGPPSALASVESFNPRNSVAAALPVSSLQVLPPPPEERPPSPETRPRLDDVGKGPSLDSSNTACSCSFQCLPPPPVLPTDDNDDYRSECENCKSTPHGSSYYLDEEGEGDTPQQETMTLHRRPEHDETAEQRGYYRTSLTLPTNTRRTRTGSSGAPLHGTRENWFSSMPASSTSSTSSEEE
uniref:Mucin-12 n=1 Tax=Locusta migratoria TaxID=7004 RepID=A0A7D4WZ58_LOCMI|nr:mucin-12 [Locusta migratoria]